MKYLLLKHYRGAPAAVNDVPMDQWTPAEVDAHMQYMSDFAKRLQETVGFVHPHRRQRVRGDRDDPSYWSSRCR